MADRAHLTRRAALQGLGIGLGSVAIGCGGDEEGAPAPEPTSNGSGNGSAAPPASTGTAPSQPDTPISTSPPAPALTPAQLLSATVDNIVVLMMENRSFDHFLGSLANDPAYASKANVEGLAGTESNPAPNGTSVGVYKLDNFTPADPPHGWDAAHAQFNAGKNDGFVKAHAGDSEKEVMGYHDRSQIPLYYWFADNFTVCDHWFSSVMGPTWPNRFYLHATTSSGKKDNKPILVNTPDTIWDRLKDANIKAKNYAAGAATFFVGGFVTKVLSNNPSASINDFFEAAKNGTLPPFSVIDPDFQASDDHPSHNIQRGQAFVASVYKALAESPQWSKTLLVIIYDENGGFFDHVAPPKTADDNADFQQLGFRVPAFLIGPMVKKGYVMKTQLEHSSVAATLKTRFGIKSLTKRMDAANDISDCIDAAKVTAPAPPPAGMPQVAMTQIAALYDGVGVSSQPLLTEMVDSGRVPTVNARDHQVRIAGWLEHAKRLGAVRIVGS